MRIKHLLNFFVATVFIGMAVGCAEKDLYDPNYGKEPVKGPEEYFGFETRGDVSLDVNYALSTFAIPSGLKKFFKRCVKLPTVSSPTFSSNDIYLLSRLPPSPHLHKEYSLLFPFKT